MAYWNLQLLLNSRVFNATDWALNNLSGWALSEKKNTEQPSWICIIIIGFHVVYVCIPNEWTAEDAMVQNRETLTCTLNNHNCGGETTTK